MTPDLHIRSTYLAKIWPTCIEAADQLAGGDGGNGGNGGGDVVIDSWPVENQNDFATYGIKGSIRAVYQAFTMPQITPSRFSKITLSLRRVGNPVGNLTVAVYNDAAGAYPTITPIPIGAPIHTSLPLDAATITTDPAGALYDFLFGISRMLTAGQIYCLVLEKVDDGSGPLFSDTDCVMVGLYMGDEGHYGNAGIYQGSGWLADDYSDMIFYLYE